MDPRRTAGGILKLRELIEEHPAELTYDLRSRFGLSLNDIGETITYLEALYLISVLERDPSSWLQAAIHDWSQPVSREWMLVANLYDLFAAVNSKKKPKQYPRPWQDADTTRIGSKKPQKRSDVIASLERMNPKENDG